MSGIATSAGAVTRAQDRLSLHDLHDRLTHYIRHVQDLKYKVQAVDSSAFLESIGVLEEGLATLKHSYEKELDKARRENEDLNNARNEYCNQLKRSQDLVGKLESRLVDENERNEKAQDELNTLHRTVAQKDSELHEAQMALRPPTEGLDKANRENEKLLRENQDLQKKYGTEESARQELQERNHQLRERVDFQEKMHQQTVQDLTERLHSASQTILSLEAKVRELAKPDTSLTDMLARVRDAAEAQLRMYREESEASFSQSLTALKAQIDQDTKRIEELTERNVRQNGEMGELMATIRKMEGMIGALEHQKRSLEDIVQNERHHAREHIGNLEDKLRDLQDVLVHKMRELNAARDAQLPLRAEIEALRTLLDEEERRLAKLPQLGLMPKPLHGQSGLPMPIFPKVPQAPTNRYTVSPRGPTETVGPVRARSAPAKGAARLVPTNLGQGKDYFDSLFNELKPGGDFLKVHSDSDPESSGIPETPTMPLDRPHKPEPGTNPPLILPDRPMSTMSHDYPTATSSATGNLSILEVHPEGRYIRLVNRSAGKDEEFGGYLIQQNVGGHPVAVYRFPPRIRFAVGSTITVWAGTSDPIMHQPPTDFVFKEQMKWGTGPECTTILCKPNGQAVAWTTAAHRFTRNAYDNQNQPMTPSAGSHYEADEALNENNNNHGSVDDTNEDEGQELTEIQLPVNGARSDAVYLRREKAAAPSLAAQKHPHGVPPAGNVHPHTSPPRPQTYGNDNSTMNRQSRVQSSRPDPIPGAPYAGASGQRMGSASLRAYSPAKQTFRGSGAIANQAAGSIRHGLPTPFLSPLQQDYAIAHDNRNTALVKLSV